MAGKLKLKLREGDPAPDFSAPASGGGTVSLADFKGKPVVLYSQVKPDEHAEEVLAAVSPSEVRSRPIAGRWTS